LATLFEVNIFVIECRTHGGDEKCSRIDVELDLLSYGEYTDSECLRRTCGPNEQEEESGKNMHNEEFIVASFIIIRVMKSRKNEMGGAFITHGTRKRIRNFGRL
jgi:hypothetical protein